MDPEAEEALDLVTIDEQTRDMLRLFFTLGVAVAVLLAWSEHFPLGATFEAIAIPLTGGLTLLEAVKAILIVVFTYIATKNLPGLLELAVLRATTIEAGTEGYLSAGAGESLFSSGLDKAWSSFSGEPIRVAYSRRHVAGRCS